MTPYELIGGQEVVAKIVNKFYDLVETDPAYAKLHAMHAGDLSEVREGLTGFLTGWMGGPRDWFAKGKCVVSAHKPLSIDTEVAEQWIDAVKRAIMDTPIDHPELPEKLVEALDGMARSMINRQEAKAAEHA